MANLNQRRIGVLLLPGLALAGWLLYGAKGDADAPGAIPHRIVLTFAGDPAHTQHVTWRTDDVLAAAKAEIAPLSGNPAFPQQGKRVDGVVAKVELPGGKFAGHSAVQFTGLAPATAYSYRVGDGKVWSEWSTFQTAAEGVAPFRFLYLGDAQNDIKSLWSRVIREAYRRVPDARMVAMAGDLVAEGYDDRLWGELFDGFGFISATVPILPCVGNHDIHQADGGNSFRTPAVWRHHFVLPHNGPEGVSTLDQQAYSVDYQGVRFVVIDANLFEGGNSSLPGREAMRDAQVAWVEKQLKENPNPWTIVMQHQGVYPIAHKRDFPELQKYLVPLYEKYKVALVLQGHDHAYGRITKNGVTYMISVSGPKMYELDSKYAKQMDKTITNEQMYQVVDVNAARIALGAYSVDGRLLDSVEIKANR